MKAMRSIRKARLVAALALCAMLASSAGCGFCFFEAQCRVLSDECCRSFRCEPCLLMLAKAETPDATADDGSKDFVDLITTLFPPNQY